jgi:hypothetical protein
MYIRKSLTNVLLAVTSVIALAAVAVWQFYLFATFRTSHGVLDVQGGAIHLWLAIGAVFVACLAGFLVFTVFLRYDKNNEMHIMS